MKVTLSAAAVTTARITVELVRAETASASSSGLDVPGQVDYDPSRVALISPRIAGRIERLAVVEGTHVGAGQTVAFISSPTFLTAQTDLQQAARRAALLGGTPDAEGAPALVAAARRRLRLLGAGDALIRRVERGGEPESLLPVVAPFSGTIVEARTLAGAAVEPGTPLFRIADLSVVDVLAQVPERALSFLRIGQGASIGIAAYPAMRFTGSIERIKAELDPTTRTVKAVLHVTNSGGALRPGMFASVRLNVPLSRTIQSASESALQRPTGAAVLTIPDAAVLSDGERRYVFVEVAPRTYERR
ncbi:MAG: efflux RND transporter periplasmic adaptor subunit, partial [Gemmatimonadaceae bacterium]